MREQLLSYDRFVLAVRSGSPTMDRKPDCDSGKPGNSRNSYRIFVIVLCVISIIILMIAVPTYFWLISESWNEFPCNFNLSVPLSNRETFPNGSVSDDGVVYPREHYFSFNNATRGCICALKPCIRKCCGEGEFYVRVPGEKAVCQKNPSSDPFDNFTIPVYNSSRQLIEVPPGHFRVLYGDVCQSGKFLLDPESYEDDKHLLMDDGRILMEGEVETQSYKEASQYCLESNNGSEQIRTFVCFGLSETKEVKAKFTLYSIGMMTSIPFMVATFLVYGVVSELRNLHGKSLMSQTASLCVSYVGLTIIQVGRDDFSKFWCVFLAFMVQFTFLASYFWMNVMCFDIWWVFSGLRAPRGSAKERDHKKFILYSAYAWGVPAVILAISLIMDLVPSIPDSFIKPGFGSIRCWFKDPSGTLLYFYFPITIIVLLNITMFVTTACKLKAHTKETKVLHGSESRQSAKADKDRFNLYLKLFVVMGINWVFELVSFFGGGPNSLWFVTDIGNTLQGVFIFLIFVCKRRVIRLVHQKVCPCWLLTSASTSTSGSTQSGGSTRTTSTLVPKPVPDNPSSTPQ